MAAATWDPSHSSSNNTLSNGNLTATIISDNITSATYSTNAVISGTYYWEVVPQGSGFLATSGLVGLGNTSSLTSSWIGQTASTIGIEFDGIVWNAASSVVTLRGYNVTSDRVCFALDLDNKKLWIRTESNGWNNDVIGNQDPATNTGGLVIPSAVYAFPVVAAFNTQNNTPTADTVTANFSSASWVNTAPSGFVSLDSAPPLPMPYNRWPQLAPLLAQ